jgi:tetratricopeptide (TPR) repeat protein
LGRGIAEYYLKDYDRAITDCTDCLEIAHDDDEAFHCRAVCWAAKREYDKAIADYDEAIRIKPDLAITYRNRSNVWIHKKEYDKAIADYTEAIRLEPKNADDYNELAWLWATCPSEKYRDGKRAVETATKACELSEWKEANKIGTLAAAHAESGDFDKAVEWEEKAHKLYSDDDKKKWGKLLDLYKLKKPYRDEGP